MRSLTAIGTLVAAATPGAQTTPRQLAERSEAQCRRGLIPILAEVVRSSPASATILLSAVAHSGNSGDDTIAGMEFSGVYEAAPEDGAVAEVRVDPDDRLLLRR